MSCTRSTCRSQDRPCLREWTRWPEGDDARQTPPLARPAWRGHCMSKLGRRVQLTLAVAVVASALSGILSVGQANAVLVFVISAVALATLATLVGQATEQLGERLGPAATGILQSALGNLPELFVAIFA